MPDVAFTFDVKMFAVVRVAAPTEEDARRKLQAALDGASVNAGCWPGGDPILFDVSLDGEADLID